MRFFISTLLVLTAVSCGTETAKELTAQDYYSKIQKHEEKLSSIAGNDRKIEGAKLVEEYKLFAKNFPQDSATAEYLFRAGREEAFQGNFESSLRIYERILKHYPDYVNAGNVAFMIAFTYDAHLSEYGKAEIAYQKFIDSYPDHRLVEDAKVSLEHLGMSDEELLKKLQSQQNQEKES